MQKLDPETRERFEKGEMDEEEMKNLGILGDDLDEEGEAEIEDYGSGSDDSKGEDAGSGGDDDKDEDDYEEGE